MLDNSYAILFIRGERPVIDEKYSIFTHPDVGLTVHGGAAPYLHGQVNHSIADISLTGTSANILSLEGIIDTMYELLSNEDIEEEFSI